jgi:hypothetical protein
VLYNALLALSLYNDGIVDDRYSSSVLHFLKQASEDAFPANDVRWWKTIEICRRDRTWRGEACTLRKRTILAPLNDAIPKLAHWRETRPLRPLRARRSDGSLAAISLALLVIPGGGLSSEAPSALQSRALKVEDQIRTGGKSDKSK